MGSGVSFLNSKTIPKFPRIIIPESKLNVEDACVPNYAVMCSCIPDCQQDWRKIVEFRKLIDNNPIACGIPMFCARFGKHLSAYKNADIMIEKLNYGWTRKKVEIVFVALKLILSMNAPAERDVIRKLKSLGREHARLGIDGTLLYPFVSAIVCAIMDHFDENMDQKSDNLKKIANWAAIFRFAIHHMTADKICFVRSYSEMITQSLSESNHVVDFFDTSLPPDEMDEERSLNINSIDENDEYLIGDYSGEFVKTYALNKVDLMDTERSQNYLIHNEINNSVEQLILLE